MTAKENTETGGENALQFSDLELGCEPSGVQSVHGELVNYTQHIRDMEYDAVTEERSRPGCLLWKGLYDMLM